MTPDVEEMVASMPPATNPPADVHELEEVNYGYGN